MSTPTITTKRTVDDEVIDLYVDDASWPEPAANPAEHAAGTLAAYVDVFLVGDDECPETDRVTVMTSKVQQAYELIESLPCLCDNNPSDNLAEADDRCRRCRVIGEHTPQHDTTHTATSTVDIVARTLVQLGLAADLDSAHKATHALTMALWSERMLIGSDEADATMRDENTLLHQQLATITQGYHETDTELCEACDAMPNRGPCPFHNGHTSGALHLAEIIGAVCDDPDLADRVSDLIADRDDS
nr:hypothetical protein [Kibdelosporangium sp. MJ126-NF4]CEL19680.1 hypothetical protein [Kibdelosporangium sp. MJ126-NF4]CTQ94520.1 hypothetical protein [Kibdelosporangium sp. MJ126-NF4]